MRLTVRVSVWRLAFTDEFLTRNSPMNMTTTWSFLFPRCRKSGGGYGSTKFVKTVLTLDGGRSPFGILFQLETAWRVCKDSSVTMSGAGRNLQWQGRATHADKNEAQEGSESEEAGFYQF